MLTGGNRGGNKLVYTTVRIWEETRRLLRLIAADTGEQMVGVMHRLCEKERAMPTARLVKIAKLWYAGGYNQFDIGEELSISQDEVERSCRLLYEIEMIISAKKSTNVAPNVAREDKSGKTPH